MDATDNELVEAQYYGCCVVDLYNQRRRHSTLGQISPAEFEKRATTRRVDPVENHEERGFPPAPHASFCTSGEDDRTKSDQLTATVH
jgi:hypothetical protein